MGEEYRRDDYGTISAPIKNRSILDEKFEDLFLWTMAGTGADPTLEKYGSKAYEGSYSMRMQTRSTAPQISDYVQASKQVHLMERNILSLSSIFWFSSHAELDTIAFRMLNDGHLIGPDFGIRYSTLFNRIQVLNYAGGWSDSALTLTGLAEQTWHKIKVSANINTGYYTTIEVNSIQEDISTRPIRDLGGGGLDTSEARITLKNRLAAQTTSYIDNVIIENI